MKNKKTEEPVKTGEEKGQVNELVSCPFCGEKASCPPEERGVHCSSCGASMQYTLDPGNRLAINAWNTRAS